MHKVVAFECDGSDIFVFWRKIIVFAIFGQKRLKMAIFVLLYVRSYLRARSQNLFIGFSDFLHKVVAYKCDGRDIFGFWRMYK